MAIEHWGGGVKPGVAGKENLFVDSRGGVSSRRGDAQGGKMKSEEQLLVGE